MDKTVLITGAGRGLGRALAKAFRARGWAVIATDLVPDLLKDLPDTEGYLAIPLDVTSKTSVDEAFRIVQGRFATIDLLINNAGMDRYFPLSEAPVTHFKEIFEVNLFGAYRVTQTFLPLLKQPSGGVIAVGSESLHLSLPFLSYPITKRALESYILALRQELRFSGRWATIVRCGPIRTKIVEDLYHIRNQAPEGQLQPVFEWFAASVPKQIGRVMEPSEVAERIVRIVSAEHPKGIYRINNRITLRMMKWIPFGVVERRVHRRLVVR
jgi:NAD(P)-dependent dehydrogenase (short-subunit alcohol dehydrogenase family)